MSRLDYVVSRFILIYAPAYFLGVLANRMLGYPRPIELAIGIVAAFSWAYWVTDKLDP